MHVTCNVERVTFHHQLTIAPMYRKQKPTTAGNKFPCRDEEAAQYNRKKRRDTTLVYRIVSQLAPRMVWVTAHPPTQTPSALMTGRLVL